MAVKYNYPIALNSLTRIALSYPEFNTSEPNNETEEKTEPKAKLDYFHIALGVMVMCGLPYLLYSVLNTWFGG